MQKKIFIFFIFLSLIISLSGFSEEPKKEVLVITVNGVINPASAEYITKNIKRANERKVEAFVIELDTPGGLDT